MKRISERVLGSVYTKTVDITRVVGDKISVKVKVTNDSATVTFTWAIT